MLASFSVDQYSRHHGVQQKSMLNSSSVALCVQKKTRGDLKILLRLAKKAPAHARNCFGHYDIERTENVENGALEGSKIEVN